MKGIFNKWYNRVPREKETGNAGEQPDSDNAGNYTNEPSPKGKASFLTFGSFNLLIILSLSITVISMTLAPAGGNYVYCQKDAYQIKKSHKLIDSILENEFIKLNPSIFTDLNKIKSNLKNRLDSNILFLKDTLDNKLLNIHTELLISTYFTSNKEDIFTANFDYNIANEIRPITYNLVNTNILNPYCNEMHFNTYKLVNQYNYKNYSKLILLTHEAISHTLITDIHYWNKKDSAINTYLNKLTTKEKAEYFMLSLISYRELSRMSGANPRIKKVINSSLTELVSILDNVEITDINTKVKIAIFLFKDNSSFDKSKLAIRYLSKARYYVSNYKVDRILMSVVNLLYYSSISDNISIPKEIEINSNHKGYSIESNCGNILFQLNSLLNKDIQENKTLTDNNLDSNTENNQFIWYNILINECNLNKISDINKLYILTLLKKHIYSSKYGIKIKHKINSAIINVMLRLMKVGEVSFSKEQFKNNIKDLIITSKYLNLISQATVLNKYYLKLDGRYNKLNPLKLNALDYYWPEFDRNNSILGPKLIENINNNKSVTYASFPSIYEYSYIFHQKQLLTLAEYYNKTGNVKSEMETYRTLYTSSNNIMKFTPTTDIHFIDLIKFNLISDSIQENSELTILSKNKINYDLQEYNSELKRINTQLITDIDKKKSELSKLSDTVNSYRGELLQTIKLKNTLKDSIGTTLYLNRQLRILTLEANHNREVAEKNAIDAKTSEKRAWLLAVVSVILMFIVVLLLIRTRYLARINQYKARVWQEFGHISRTAYTKLISDIRSGAEKSEIQLKIQNMADLMMSIFNSIQGGTEAMGAALSDEIVLLNNYVKHKNLLNNISVELRSPNEIPDIKVPPAILLSLIKNSIEHGKLIKRGTGVIELKVEKIKNRYTISIIDNGDGFKNIFRLKDIKDKNSTGLKNCDYIVRYFKLWTRLVRISDKFRNKTRNRFLNRLLEKLNNSKTSEWFRGLFSGKEQVKIDKQILEGSKVYFTI